VIARFEAADVILGAGVRVLSGITLDLPHGAIVGLVGESGSGKTTLGRALLGLVPPSAGRVLVDGEPVARHLARDARAFRRRVQMLQQDAAAALSPRMRIRTALEEPARIHRLPLAPYRARLAALLDRLALPEAVLDRYPHQLSGGQARRVGVLRALLVEPRLIVADEPTAGLDVSVQGEVLNLLLDLREELGVAFLLVSHNLNVVRRVSDRVAVMYLGQVVEEAPAAALFAAPAHPYSAALVSANPALRPGPRPAPIVLAGEMPAIARPPAGCRFHTRCPVARARCRNEPPALAPIDATRQVRCHFPFALAA
jgi:peptide/nickel transport system ATP-binding protein